MVFKVNLPPSFFCENTYSLTLVNTTAGSRMLVDAYLMRIFMGIEKNLDELIKAPSFLNKSPTTRRPADDEINTTMAEYYCPQPAVTD